MRFDTWSAAMGADDAVRVGVGFEHSLSDKGRIGAKIDYTKAIGGRDDLLASLNLSMKF